MTQIAQKKNGFGTLPVFLTTISTILGAILFLRFGYAVGNVGFWGTMGIIVLGHIVTISTAMAVSEIATNQKVEGGGAYFIISRSFGLNIGAAIGLALFLAQAISVAFYVIAFAEAFRPTLEMYLSDNMIFKTIGMRIVSIPAMILLTILILTKGANIGVKALYVVCAILFVAIIIFFMGSTDYVVPDGRFSMTVANPDSFFYVFTIIFPAFTGIAAGLGLSGDLKDPKKSIPYGTLSATLVGMIVYVLVAYKLTTSASPETLANDYFAMAKIAYWGPAIMIGLAAATISSALGSIMIAPRTLQALGADKVFPSSVVNRLFSKELKNEPINATVLTCIIAFVFVLMGDVNFVAEIISMFFMVTYGAICLVSFLEHFAADPHYRPTFRSKWYLSLIGAVACFWLMFKMNFMYAILSIAIMAVIYIIVTYYNKEKAALSKIFQGVIFQFTRNLQLFLQKSNTEVETNDWRPSVVCISKNYFERLDAFDMLRWISQTYGFGTYIHHIDGYLSKDTHLEAQQVLKDLIKTTEDIDNKIFFNTIVSPSSTTAIAQVMQLPGITGKENNTLLFEYFRDEEESESLNDFIANFNLIKSIKFDLFLLSSSQRGFAFQRNIHIWLTTGDYENANLMILTAFIILGHKDWKGGEIKLFVLSKQDNMEEERERVREKIKEGRLPISAQNVEIIEDDESVNNKTIINNLSKRADLTVIGFRQELLKRYGKELFSGYDELGNIMFVNSSSEIEIK